MTWVIVPFLPFYNGKITLFLSVLFCIMGINNKLLYITLSCEFLTSILATFMFRADNYN